MYAANEDSMSSSEDVKLKTRFQGQVCIFCCAKKFNILSKILNCLQAQSIYLTNLSC